jgi:hypothetical protein
MTDAEHVMLVFNLAISAATIFCLFLFYLYPPRRR